MISVKEVADKDIKKAITLKIMHSLPDWFSPPEDIEKKAIIHKDYPFFSAYEGDNAIGFLALKLHNEYTAEIFNMGVIKDYHRKGIGDALVKAVEAYCKSKGLKYLTVKTLDSSAHY